jgi:replicative DNA helicase
MNRTKLSDFTNPDDQKIFGAMVDLFNRGEAVDMVTVAHELSGSVDDVAHKLACLVDLPLWNESILDVCLRKVSRAAIEWALKRELKEKGGA